MSVPSIRLNDGSQIPQFGFGVYQIEPKDTVAAVKQALELGYRHIDTAQMYGNEAEVGQAIKESGIDPSEIWVTSKLNNGFHKHDDAMQAIDDSLSRLGIEQLDMFIIHWPLPTIDVDFVDTWRAMEQMQSEGKVRTIGVSNFQVSHLERIIKESDTIPAVNQIELHPYLTQRDLTLFGATHGIATEAWSPIAQGAVLDEPILKSIGEKYGKSAAQVTLRWHIQLGYIVFPKSVNPERMKQNIEIFDFELTNDEMAQITGLNKDERTGPDPDTFAYIPR